MLHPGGGDPAATGKSGRWRALLEHDLEHRLRPARHRKFVGEDHNRRRSRVHADRPDARSAKLHRLAIDPGINPGHRTGSKPESIANSGSVTGSITISTGDLASGTSNIAGRTLIRLNANRL